MSIKNRKKALNTRPVVPAPFAIVMVIASSISLGYLWLGSRCETLGVEIKALEATSADLHRKCLYEESRWANTIAPREIEQALQRHDVTLSWPVEAQIVRLDMSDEPSSHANASQMELVQYSQVRRSPMHE